MSATAVHHHHYHRVPYPAPDDGAREVCVATFANGQFHSVHRSTEAARRNLTSYHRAHLTFHNENHKVKVVANYDDGGTITLYWLHPNEEVR